MSGRMAISGTASAARSALAELPARPSGRTAQLEGARIGTSTPAKTPVWRFGDLPLRPKLVVGAANDRFEHEADAAADRVMRMPALSRGTPRLSRSCAACDETLKAEVPAKCDACEADSLLQRQAAAPAPAAAGAAHVFRAEGVLITLRSSCDSVAGFSFGVVEAAVRDALDKIFNGTCIEATHRTAMQANLRSHGFEFRAADSATLQNAGACAEGTGFSIPANIVTLGTAALGAGCGPLASTVLHEIVHIIRGFFGEALPRSCEASCYGQAGDPKLCHDLDVKGRPAAPPPKQPGGVLQRAATTDGMAGRAVPDSVHRVLGSAGRPLGEAMRVGMEQRFGHDFSAVRVHDDSAAASSARDVQAHAYTVGNHIAFAQGALRDDSSGQRLLAHELAHVVQQSGSALQRDFDSTLSICERVLESRTFHVANGAVAARLQATLQSNGSNTGPAGCSGQYFYAALVRTDTLFDHELASEPIPFDAAVTRTWTGLEEGEYRLRFWSNDTSPVCCLEGNVSVSTAAATGQVIPTLPSEACFDGDQIYVRKGGGTAACPALTGTVGAPTPDGRFCIRHQGEAQVSGGLKGRLFQDRSQWFLLEPQFATTRSRMMLHPGTMSEGCITVMDRACFHNLASTLQSGASTPGTGTDGYPPGNSAGVTNSPRPVDCAGILTVNRRPGGCVSAAVPAGPAPPVAAPPKLPASSTLMRSVDTGSVLRRDPVPGATPAPAAASDEAAWLTAFPRASRKPGTSLKLTQSMSNTAPVLSGAELGGAPLTPDKQALKDAIVAARAAQSTGKFKLVTDPKAGTGWEYGGTTPAKPSAITADAATPPTEAQAARKAAVRAAVWTEVTGNEGGASAINAYDPARLTWGPGMTLSGPLTGALNTIFGDPKARAVFLRNGIDWVSGSFLVFNEANNAVESGGDALSLIQGRTDLLAVFVFVAESPDTSQVVADAQFARLNKMIGEIPDEMNNDWDIDVLRVAFHLNYMRGLEGYSMHKQAYLDTKGDIMSIVMTWGRLTAGAPEKSGASMISSPGFANSMTQFDHWGNGVAGKAIRSACPVPVPLRREEARDPARTELANLLLIRTPEKAKTGDEPRGFYVLPKPPANFPGVAPAPAMNDPLYYDLFELNGMPAAAQIGRAEQWRDSELERLANAWDDPASGLSVSFSVSVGLLLHAVQIKRRRTSKTPKPDPAAAALAATPDFTTVDGAEPERAKLLHSYLGI